MRSRWIPWTLCLAATLAALPADADPNGGPSLLEQARARTATAYYAEAADLYERFVQEDPKAAAGPEALSDAIILRLGLSQVEQARADAELFVKLYGRADPARAGRVVFAMAASRFEHEDWRGASQGLEAWAASFEPSASLDERIVARAMLGQAFVRLNDGKKAEAEYGRVMKLWNEPGTAERIASAGDDRRLAKALNAVGEALFFFAEKKRREVDKILFPVLKGPQTRDTVMKHINTKVKDWVVKKRPAIEEMEKEYRKVVELQPVPPPRWVIASAARVGQTWGKFVAEFRAAPIPKEWKGNGIVPGTTDLTYRELRQEWYRALDEASEPQKQTAKGAFKVCVDYSVKFQYTDDYSRTCTTWLAKNYRTEFHPLDEFVPQPRWLGAASPTAAPLPDSR